MKPDTSVIPLMLLMLLVTAHGIRLVPVSVPPNQQEIKETKELGGGVTEVVLCKDGHCSGTGRKLIGTVERSPSTSENARDEGMKVEAKPKHHERNPFDRSREGLFVKSTDSNAKSTNEKYPDIIDIAGMDYSSARRKPPIHN